MYPDGQEATEELKGENMALTKKEREQAKKIFRPYVACARKLGITPFKRWTAAEKKAMQACVKKMKRSK